MITPEQKEEVIKLYKESRPKAQISSLVHISRPKVSEIIKENEKNSEQKRENESASDMVKKSIKGLKNELIDYERALQRIKEAANDDLLGPSVKKAVAREGFILKESASGIREQIASFLDDLNVKDAVKVLEMLKEIVSISNIRNEEPVTLKRYAVFAHHVAKKGYSLDDMNFLIQKGQYLEMFRDYQKSIDMIVERFGVPEHEALGYAFIGINEYFRRGAELEKVNE